MRRTGLVFAVVFLACGAFGSSALAGTSSGVAGSPFQIASPAIPTPFSAAFSPSRGRLATADPGYDAVTVFAVKQSIRSFSAVPAQLASSGGKVKLEAAVRGAVECRFSSANSVNGLPVRKDCASGGASVTITLPANTKSAARTYKFELTARSAAGKRITKHVTVVEMLKSVAQPQPSALQPVAPQITVEPESQSAGLNDNVTLTAAASGVPTPNVQWQVSTNDGATWADLPPSAGESPTSYTVELDDGEFGTYTGSEIRAVFTNVAGSATTNPATLTVSTLETGDWAGYIDFAPPGEVFTPAFALPGENFTSVSADWVVPNISCATSGENIAVQWPGIGFQYGSVVQDGTIEGCVGTTPGADAAWYELLGDPAVNGGGQVELPIAQYPVAAGDHIAASVSIANSIWTLAITNSTQGWVFNISEPDTTPPLDETAAEVVTEGDDAGGEVANFGTTNFTAATATLNGQTGPLGAFFPVAVAMYAGSTPTAVPGPFDSTGENFTDTWDGY
jgi:uncharacterized membrane protein YtjA (UPF0391 family)